MPINNLFAGKEPFSRAKIKSEEDVKGTKHQNS